MGVSVDTQQPLARGPKKPIRSASGVSVVTVVTMPFACPHGRCVYCPGGPGQDEHDGKPTPNSYTHLSPAILHAMHRNYDPYEQVRGRINALQRMSHPTSKIELIIIGGTFLFFPPGYCENFVKRCFDAMNDSDSECLEEAQKRNESAEHRCVAFCVETKPELCTEDNIRTLLRFGVTRVEIGVQIPDDEIYKLVNRGHTVKDVIGATACLKDAGFKVGYHLMPNLPGSTIEKDGRLFASLFEDPRFRPDALKIYPTQAVKGSLLEKWYEQGKFVPYSKDELLRLLVDFKRVVPPYCRIMRIQRQISQDLMRNPLKGDLRKAAKELLDNEGASCKCIRCKEFGFNRKAKGPWRINEISYDASGGKEWFLSWQNPDGVLKGILRLRRPLSPFAEGTDTSTLFVRELHVYGTEIPVDGSQDITLGSAQHEGIGKALMNEAERVAKEQGCGRIAVISGVGAREYYRRLGYERNGSYMVRELTLLP